MKKKAIQLIVRTRDQFFVDLSNYPPDIDVQTIPGTRTQLDLFKDEAINLTQTIQNVRDIGSIFTDFSQSFSLPASKTNNKVFRHYYNMQIGNNFNANDKLEAEIQINYATFRIGFIALDGVKMKSKKPHTYKVTFFGETVDLKKKLKEVNLQTIFEGTNKYNHDYDLATVKEGASLSSGVNLQNAPSGAVIYPLISNTRRFVFNSQNQAVADNNVNIAYVSTASGQTGMNFGDLKPAIRLHEIITRIEEWSANEFGEGGILFDKESTDAFFRTDNDIWYNSYMHLARQKGDLRDGIDGTQIATIRPDYWQLATGTNPITGAQPVNQWNVFLDPNQPPNAGQIASLTNNLFRCRVQSQTSQTSTLTTSFAIKMDTIGTAPFTTIIEETTSGTPVIVASNESTENQTTGNHESQIPTFAISAALGSGTSTRTFQWKWESDDPTLTITNYTNIRKQVIFQDFVGTGSFTQTQATDIEPNNTSVTSTITMSNQMPKMKVLDFLSGIFKMFNLTAYIGLQNNPNCYNIKITYSFNGQFPQQPASFTYNDCTGVQQTLTNIGAPAVIEVIGQQNSVTQTSGDANVTTIEYEAQDGKIVKVQTLDSYYENVGTERDISSFVDDTEQEANFPIPYQEIAFRFKPAKSFLAFNFAEINNNAFGNLENATSEQGIASTDRGQKYVVQLPFGKMLYERLTNITGGTALPIVYGYSVDKDQNPVLTEPLIFCNVNRALASNERIGFVVNQTQTTPIASVNTPSNSFGTETINFGTEFDEFDLSAKPDTLFAKHYFNYIDGVFDPQRRLVKLKAYLPDKFLINYSLADTIIINGDKFRINSIKTDVTTGKSDLELFNITNELY